MIFENIERGFLWRDWNNVAALDNETVKGFVDTLNKTFSVDTATYVSLYTRLANITTWTAIKNGLLDEPTMDLIARQLNFPAWEYAGKYNLVAPFDTVLKRKREMLKHVVRLMQYRGSPYAIEQSLLAFGFTNVIIHENVSVDIKYDGTYIYNGVVSYSGTLKHNLFTVELTTILDLTTPPAPDEQLDAIISIINSFKKYRPELYQVIAHTPSVPAGDVRQIWNA
jgi:hypothetical protein